MGFVIFLMFLMVPVIEIGVFIEVGDVIGLWPTLAIIVATALAGTALLRAQGFAVLMRAQENMNRGEMPVGALFDGLFLLVAGVLLLTPGFVTDSLGLALFFPPLRRFIGIALLSKLMKNGNFQGHMHTRRYPGNDSPGSRGRGPNKTDDITDIDYEELPPRK